jgi:hypothetical protein
MAVRLLHSRLEDAAGSFGPGDALLFGDRRIGFAQAASVLISPAWRSQ